MSRIGILGGSFDPIHEGHLRLAEAARRSLALDRVILVPAARQPLKTGGHGAPAEDRLAMARLVAVGRPWLEVSPLEIERGGASYTIETLEALRARLGSEAELFLILGSDAFRDIERWHRAADVVRIARPAVAARPGTALDPRAAAPPLLIPMDPLDVSSTELRRRLEARAPGTVSLVPAEVLEYIERRGLYGWLGRS